MDVAGYVSFSIYFLSDYLLITIFSMPCSNLFWYIAVDKLYTKTSAQHMPLGMLYIVSTPEWSFYPRHSYI